MHRPTFIWTETRPPQIGAPLADSASPAENAVIFSLDESQSVDGQNYKMLVLPCNTASRPQAHSEGPINDPLA